MDFISKLRALYAICLQSDISADILEQEFTFGTNKDDAKPLIMTENPAARWHWHSALVGVAISFISNTAEIAF